MASTDLLATFQKHIEDMRNLSLCKICIKPFYEPFILPCGHTYCYSCLASWFGGGTGRRSKSTCPDCRANVRVEPSPNYLLRDLVHMFIGRAELLPEDETVQEHQTAKEEEAVLLAADRAGPGLFKGVFVGLGSAGGSRNWRSGILDPEDNVWRCPECHWELEDGGCSRCGFHQFDMTGSDSDSDLDESIDLDDSEMDDEAEIDHEFGTTMGEHGFHFHYPATSTRRRSISPGLEDDEDYSDEDDDMDGFIDNEVEDGDSNSDADTESTMTIYNRQLRNHRDNDHPSVSSGVSHDGDIVSHFPYDPAFYPESDARSTVNTAQSTNGDQSDAATNYDEMTEASDIDTAPAQPARRSGARRVVLTSDDEDEDEPGVNPSATADRSAEERLHYHGDDHDTDNEADFMASVRHRLRRRARNVADSHSDDDDDDEPNSGSEDSDDSIRPPQSSSQRRQHLNNQRARRGNHMVVGGYAPINPPRQQYPNRQQSHRGRGNTNRYQPYQRPFGRRIPVGGENSRLPA
ncbi:hypothetical protein G647_10129 [Cladophialophora carrionii CBS 160.54]|uniref:RING-type domain-containing protein n=1 Tax=Cladophialophora carrionii CBS 160.54 TaxID=1279043 RepID=V9DJJ3_9EURO|nr:uncharacterized protein G647_10129 [Cladophialophora carrionii CBS 160.54]ETI27030.1 hypothetical protein G647_10129 [Cladophialophora carrionii CBS 160.54]